MRFRQFYFVLSEDFEVSLLMKIINEYINSQQLSGKKPLEACELKRKMFHDSLIKDIAIKSPFDGE